MPRIFAVLLTVSLAAMPGAISPVRADERPEHFEGEASTSFADAIKRLADANRRLRELTEGRTPSAGDLHEIHVASYTMEKAFARLRADLDASAEALERLHLASERADADNAKAAARDYLRGAMTDGG
jgi:arginine utilization protein RocB